MSRRTQITLSDRQHAFLVGESERTGRSIAALVRKAVDTTYRPGGRNRVRGFEVSLSVREQPDTAADGRRARLL